MRLLNPRWHDTTALHSQYQQAQPFPHVVMDDFLDPGIMQVARAELQRFQDWDHDPTPSNTPYQVNKFFVPSPRSEIFERTLDSLRRTAPVTFSVLQSLKSPEFRGWLELVTGIGQILADDDWLGGGVHKITTGGFLDIHVDFNIHWKNDLHRRLNLLIYLNPGWQDTWGGALELWDTQCQACQHRVLPVFNRAVLFRITEDAYHGHPDPVRAPPDDPRLSLAMYYYTQDRPDHERAPQHGVIWQGKMRG